jgi:hypothetical protein
MDFLSKIFSHKAVACGQAATEIFENQLETATTLQAGRKSSR